jgi:hypothetical protein
VEGDAGGGGGGGGGGGDGAGSGCKSGVRGRLGGIELPLLLLLPLLPLLLAVRGRAAAGARELLEALGKLPPRRLLAARVPRQVEVGVRRELLLLPLLLLLLRSRRAATAAAEERAPQTSSWDAPRRGGVGGHGRLPFCFWRFFCFFSREEKGRESEKRKKKRRSAH